MQAEIWASVARIQPRRCPAGFRPLTGGGGRSYAHARDSKRVGSGLRAGPLGVWRGRRLFFLAGRESDIDFTHSLHAFLITRTVCRSGAAVAAAGGRRLPQQLLQDASSACGPSTCGRKCRFCQGVLARGERGEARVRGCWGSRGAAEGAVVLAF